MPAKYLILCRCVASARIGAPDSASASTAANLLQNGVVRPVVIQFTQSSDGACLDFADRSQQKCSQRPSTSPMVTRAPPGEASCTPPLSGMLFSLHAELGAIRPNSSRASSTSNYRDTER
jgi:hypothetical protein